MALLVILALIWSVASSLSIYPHSLSYFNELAAVLPTSADTSYPKAIGEDRENQSILSKIKWAISAGPRNGPRHLLDSNIDWGQDVFYLRDWLAVTPRREAGWTGRVGLVSVDVGRNSRNADATGLLNGRTRRTVALWAAGIQNVARRSHGRGRQYHRLLGPKPGWYALSVNYIYRATANIVTSSTSSR